jgi:hypothetical protein
MRRIDQGYSYIKANKVQVKNTFVIGILYPDLSIAGELSKRKNSKEIFCHWSLLKKEYN